MGALPGLWVCPEPGAGQKRRGVGELGRPRVAHNHETVGSNPTTATSIDLSACTTLKSPDAPAEHGLHTADDLSMVEGRSGRVRSRKVGDHWGSAEG